MLAVGPRLAPVDWRGVVIDGDTIPGHVLAVALHGELLQVGGESLEVLLVGQHRNGLAVKEVAVPETDKSHDRSEILLEGCRAHVLVHRVKAIQHFLAEQNACEEYKRPHSRR